MISNDAEFCRSGNKLKINILLSIWIVMYLLVGITGSNPALAGAAYVGMQPQELTPDVMAALGLEGQSGVIIRNVGQGTPASRAGIVQGDVIHKINGKTLHVKMVVGDWDDATRVRKGKSGQLNTLGLTLISMSDKIRTQFKIRWDVEGVMVSIVGPAKGLSETLKRGDVIVQINQQKIWKPEQMAKIYDQAIEAGRKKVILLVLRNTGFVFVVLPVRQK